MDEKQHVQLEMRNLKQSMEEQRKERLKIIREKIDKEGEQKKLQEEKT